MSLEERWLGMVISHVVDGNRKVILHLFGGVGFQKYSKHALTKSFYVFSRRLAAGWQPTGSRLAVGWQSVDKHLEAFTMNMRVGVFESPDVGAPSTYLK